MGAGRDQHHPDHGQLRHGHRRSGAVLRRELHLGDGELGRRLGLLARLLPERRGPLPDRRRLEHGSYSDPTADRLIKETNYGDASLSAYENYLAKNLPVVWQPNAGVRDRRDRRRTSPERRRSTRSSRSTRKTGTSRSKIRLTSRAPAAHAAGRPRQQLPGPHANDMTGYLIRRVVQAIIVVFGVTLLVFSSRTSSRAARPAPRSASARPRSRSTTSTRSTGTTCRSGSSSTSYVKGLVLHLNLGYSYKENQSVLSEIQGKLPKTLSSSASRRSSR